ncbi:hypothetical protein GXM_03028 [Nostoc sphaeroides CCNUC1]|uniref:Uncharacterized protein n=1 Tax=Nostoc sphaeroides CCNUC1 TaxID=2653204 RepID=A0A5P8VZ06_9NOSO|nr:hypothetical protein GXM_03028 [Nostoc sphaeroides CCNUC1]
MVKIYYFDVVLLFSADEGASIYLVKLSRQKIFISETM